MKGNAAYIWVLALFFSCNEKVLQPPENLISEGKMVAVLTELAIVNAAKSTNITVLSQNEFVPMEYLFEKFDIDSVQFVESDRYYASQPVKYEEIYLQVQSKLETIGTEIHAVKKVNDSIKLQEAESKKLTKRPVTIKDSLP
tara:strand:- start:4246 stop:4671 length:426 start_codon:yes stop_codon:yes gene_type:complete